MSSLWTAYPIVFALAEGTNKISVDAEIIAYAVLDVYVFLIYITLFSTDLQLGQDRFHVPLVAITQP